MKPGAPQSSTVEATMAWYDAAGSIVERPVSDLGAVLRELEPVPAGLTTPPRGASRSTRTRSLPLVERRSVSSRV
jgi:hypothetical protein